MRRSGRGEKILQRARPLLGTLVAMRVEGLSESHATAVIERAFEEVAAVHRYMSFHATDSDVARLHASRVGACVAVDPRTMEVLQAAVNIAAISEGRFDPTIARALVQWQLLPKPCCAWLPDPRADWRDLELVDARHVRLRRAVWIDLGGIAKGYAVDRAIAILVGAGASKICVNAGGDLRVAGSESQTVVLRPGAGAHATLPFPAQTIEVTNAAVATSASAMSKKVHASRYVSAQVDARRGRPISSDLSVSVVAPTCLLADALTKVALSARGAERRKILKAFGAEACVHSQVSGWQRVDLAA